MQSGKEKIKTLRNQIERQQAFRENAIDPELVAWALNQLEFVVKWANHHRPGSALESLENWVERETL